MKIQNFLFLLFFNLAIFSQDKGLTSTEYLKLQNEVRSLSVTNVDSAIFVANRIEKSNSKLHKAFAKSAKGYLYSLLNNRKQSDFYFKEAFESIKNEKKSIETTRTFSYIYNYKGASEWYFGNFKKALFYYLKGEILSKEIKDKVQLTKFNTNIALLNGEIENYNEAILRLKISDKWIDQNKELYDLDQFLLNKSNTYLNLGRFYESQYLLDEFRNQKSLDSALLFFKKTLKYSENFDINRVKAKNNIGNIYLRKKDYEGAEKIYQSVIIEAKTKKIPEIYQLGIFNLASLHYGTKEYDKSILYLKKVDSIYKADKSNFIEYVNSNYMQSKIYESKKDMSLSLKHAEIYLTNFEKSQNKTEFEKTSVSSLLSHSKNLNEMKSIKERYGFKVLIKNISIYGLLLLLGIVIVLFLKNKSEKNKVEKKFEEILYQYNNKVDKENFKEIPSSKNSTLTMDEEKESEIIFKLEQIIEKKYFLNQDFTLQYVAKKIKTNTTYLSYVVNKKYGKTFSEYSNELKINYVINKMINDSKYRKYSTQAIAESVGFKNATSFTRSFSKRTGLSPVQFSQKLEEK